MIGLMDGIKVLQGLLIRHRAPAQRVTTNQQRWRATLRGAASINPVDVLVLEGAA